MGLGMGLIQVRLLLVSLVPRPSITLRGGRPGKTPTQIDVRYTLGIDIG